MRFHSLFYYYWVIFVFFIIIRCYYINAAKKNKKKKITNNNNKLNIALHAQVYPSNDKIVGSVITTDGILSALQMRYDVATVKVFYPSYYESYLNYLWDFILIEGWFPSITTFILLTRNHFPSIKIIFICLDPSYPGLNLIRSFDVDGILTNSIQVKNEFNNNYNNNNNYIPTDYLLLGANPIEFQPFINISRTYGAVYVGAGGYMLSYKPELYQLLKDSLPYGLRLHGIQWNKVPLLKDISKGSLPRYKLAEVYSSAHVVLASTIQAQDEYGMINNRIFEALSCGAIIITKYSQTLENLNCNAILFVNDSLSLAYHMESILKNENNYANNLRLNARNFIMKKHTWSHRVIQIIDFYHMLRSNHQRCLDNDNKQIICRRVSQLQCRRVNCPNLLWIVSTKLLYHSDYIFAVRDRTEEFFSSMYVIDFMSEEEFNLSVKMNCNLQWPMSMSSPNSSTPSSSSSTYMMSNESCSKFLSGYDVIFVITTFFDNLDILLSLLPSIRINNTQLLQKRISYLIGYNPNLIFNFMRNNLLYTNTTRSSIYDDDINDNDINDKLNNKKSLVKYEHNHYDVIMYRSPFELSLYQDVGIIFQTNRLQHAFGIGLSIHDDDDDDDDTLKHRSIVIVCFYSYIYLCKTSIIAFNYARARSSLLNVKHHISFTGESKLNQINDNNNDNNNDDDDDYVTIYLLIGGMWQDWLDTHEDFTLNEVIHVREGMTSVAVSVIQHATLMILMLDDTGLQHYSTTTTICNHTQKSSWDQSSVTSSTSDHDHRLIMDCHILHNIDTTRNLLWPFVVAANAYTRIFLYIYNEHYHQLNNIGCSEWNEEVFRIAMLKTAFDRLIGLGSVKSAVIVTQLTIMSRLADEWVCMPLLCDESDKLLVELYNTIITVNSTSSTSKSSSSSSSNSLNVGYTILLKVTYINYIVGQDGYLCIKYDNNDVICLLRSFDYICLYITTALQEDNINDIDMDIMQQKYNNRSSSNSTDDRTDQHRCDESSYKQNVLTIQLKGLFYGDIFYSKNITINLSYHNDKTAIYDDNNSFDDKQHSHVRQQTTTVIDDFPQMAWLKARDDLYFLPLIQFTC